MFSPYNLIIPEPDLSAIAAIGSLCFAKGSFVAGGSALAWFQQTSVINTRRDIDVFFQTEKDYLYTVDRFKLMQNQKILRKNSEVITDISLLTETGNAHTYLIQLHDDAQCIVQLIKNQHFDAPHELIRRFDLSVSQVATDGESWFTTDAFTRDIYRNVVSVERVGPGTGKRLLKYCVEYGFDDALGSFTKVCTDPISDWKIGNAQYYGL